MRSSERRPRFAVRLLPLLAAAGVLIPGYLSAAPNSPGAEVATRHLFAAVQTNDFQAVQSSIAAGADVEARNPWGNTAADVAVDKGYFRIAHYLVSIRNFQRPKAESSARGGTATVGADAKAALSRAKPTAAPSVPAARTAPAGADARAALTQPKPTAAPSVAAAAPHPIAPTVAPPPAATPTVPAAPAAIAPAAADRSAPVIATTAGGGDPFDPSRPAYGATLPAAADKGS